MSNTPSRLTYDQLVDENRFQANHLVPEGDASFDGLMFETYGRELEFVRATAEAHPGRVATLVEADGKMFVCRGFHFVNRIGYFVAKEDLPPFEELPLED